MDKLAKQQACQLFIEQEIEKGLKEGKSKYAIGHEIAAWIKKLFETDVKPDTIEHRAYRMERKIGTNVPIDPTQQDQTENEDIQDLPKHGGPREGAGRPTRKEVQSECEKKRKMDRERMAPEFKAAFNAFYEEVRKAKVRKWETTSKEAAMNCVQWMHDLITIT